MSALQSLAGTGPARHRPARSPHTRSPRARQRQGFDWAGQVKLAVVLSVAAAMVALLLADRVAEPLLCVAAFTVVDVYPGPWHTEQARERCSRCSPEVGGTPWQLVQDSVAVADQVPATAPPRRAPPTATA